MRQSREDSAFQGRALERETRLQSPASPTSSLLNPINHSVFNFLRTKDSGLRNTPAKDAPHSPDARQV